MGLFKKNKKEAKMPLSSTAASNAPSLPELPKLPDFPHMDDSYSDYSSLEGKQIHKLPSFPSNSLGTKFSQNTIKEAVTGEEEDLVYEEDAANDFADEDMEDTDEDDMRMMQPLRKPLTEEIGQRRQRFGISSSGTAEPVFIRLDRFEDALKVFNDTKRKFSEIERVLNEIKQIKEKEESELKAWENEIKNLKTEMEKVDRDIFSKI